MAEPVQTPPAVTPAAGDGAQGGQTNPTPAATPGKKEEFIVSQEQFNQRWAEKMTALEKELGIPIKDAKTVISEHNKAIEAGKTELQKLQEAQKERDEELNALKLKDSITSALLEAGANPKQLNKLALRVIGETADEIKADVAELKKDFPAMFGNYSQAGGSHPGVQDVNSQAPRVYRRSEIKAMSQSEHVRLEKDIIRAMSTPGGIIED